MQRIGIDVDNVLRDILPSIIDIYERDFGGERVNPNIITEYGVENYMSRITNPRQFFIDYAEEIFEDSKMFSNAKDVVDYLRKDNEVIIVTAQYPGLEDLTLKWLNKHDIKYDGILFGQDKSIVNLDYLIDDVEKNLDNTMAQPIAYAAPWNINYFPRVKNWGEIRRYFTK